jgi:hypothetical protein
LSGCRKTQSKEHLVSRALFDSKSVRVRGFPWCATEPREIGLSSLAANILCSHHNSILSPVDQYGGNALDEFREIDRVRRSLPPSGPNDPVHQRSVQGALLERWFIKTTINFAQLLPNDAAWQYGGVPTSQPPEVFVRAAFGELQLPEPLGLYTPAAIGAEIHTFNGIGFSFLLDASGRVGGAAFQFLGYRFLLWLSDQRLPDRYQQAEGLPPWLSGAHILFHPSGFLFDGAGRRRVAELRFSWPTP